ncbi:PIN domain-containing protein [Candidatus Daviesbacteria bacterium]|nr:PIN domain-containing protein [Candidatus Daviesbacteria bacterium]
MPRFLDTNILLRYFTGSGSEKALAAKVLLERIEQSEEKVVISVLVVFETIFTLQRTYKVPKVKIREMVGDVIALRGVQLTGKRLCLQALDLYVGKNISFADAYNVIYMQSQQFSEIYSWDTDFDRIEGITRIEPAQDM